MLFCHQFFIFIIIMKRAYKFKLKPTCKQQQKLLQHFGCARFIYNWGLDKKKRAYETDKKTLSYVDLAKELTKLKQQPTFLWLKEVANGISSVAWHEFVRQLSYKSEWFGKNVIFIGRFEPSSKTCNHCGYINSELVLKDRELTCPQCGEVLDRDVNAALNIKKMGLQQSQVR